MQVLLSACMPRTLGDGGVRFAAQLAAPHLASLWLPSTERHVLLPAVAFIAAAGSAATMLHGDSQRRRPTLTGDSHRRSLVHVALTSQLHSFSWCFASAINHTALLFGHYDGTWVGDR